jgi:hypothetical protein
MTYYGTWSPTYGAMIFVGRDLVSNIGFLGGVHSEELEALTSELEGTTTVGMLR